MPIALPDILSADSTWSGTAGTRVCTVWHRSSPLPSAKHSTVRHRLTHQQIRTSRQTGPFSLLTRETLNLECCIGSAATCTFLKANTAIVHETLNQACPPQCARPELPRLP